ncbi:MAG: hypothetical protein HOI23_04395 [Deltaproteobacteria bacterium]|jgi:tetratricopeptide (TPR) repeat protein|nr:hypothetical protein [Deltaproteobacteria bacterium]
MLGTLLGLVMLAQTVNTVDVDAELRRAGNEYAYGNYEEAILQLQDLLYPMRLSSESQVIEARELLGLCYYLTDRFEQVAAEFAKVLYLNPDHRLDPFSIPPPVIEAFENVRRQLEPQLAEIREQKVNPTVTPTANPSGGSAAPPASVQIIERSDFATFLPFGVGQFQNGDTGLGTLFAATEAALLALNIAAYFLARYSADSPEAIQKLMVLQYASATLFGVTWSIGVFQARLHFQPTITRPLSSAAMPTSPAAEVSGTFQLGFDF